MHIFFCLNKCTRHSVQTKNLSENFFYFKSDSAILINGKFIWEKININDNIFINKLKFIKKEIAKQS